MFSLVSDWRALVMTTRQVATFIIVELVVFPLGCGIMLDVCTVSLFPQGSWRGRLAFFVHAPLTSAFYHWVIGTMFMYESNPVLTSRFVTEIVT